MLTRQEHEDLLIPLDLLAVRMKTCQSINFEYNSSNFQVAKSCKCQTLFRVKRKQSGFNKRSFITCWCIDGFLIPFILRFSLFSVSSSHLCTLISIKLFIRVLMYISHQKFMTHFFFSAFLSLFTSCWLSWLCFLNLWNRDFFQTLAKSFSTFWNKLFFYTH